MPIENEDDKDEVKIVDHNDKNNISSDQQDPNCTPDSFKGTEYCIIWREHIDVQIPKQILSSQRSRRNIAKSLAHQPKDFLK